MVKDACKCLTDFECGTGFLLQTKAYLAGSPQDSSNPANFAIALVAGAVGLAAISFGLFASKGAITGISLPPISCASARWHLCLCRRLPMQARRSASCQLACVCTRVCMYNSVHAVMGNLSAHKQLQTPRNGGRREAEKGQERHNPSRPWHVQGEVNLAKYFKDDWSHGVRSYNVLTQSDLLGCEMLFVYKS